MKHARVLAIVAVCSCTVVHAQRPPDNVLIFDRYGTITSLRAVNRRESGQPPPHGGEFHLGPGARVEGQWIDVDYRDVNPKYGVYGDPCVSFGQK